jgi:hypothetical protein
MSGDAPPLPYGNQLPACAFTVDGGYLCNRPRPQPRFEAPPQYLVPEDYHRAAQEGFSAAPAAGLPSAQDIGRAYLRRGKPAAAGK